MIHEFIWFETYISLKLKSVNFEFRKFSIAENNRQRHIFTNRRFLTFLICSLGTAARKRSVDVVRPHDKYYKFDGKHFKIESKSILNLTKKFKIKFKFKLVNVNPIFPPTERRHDLRDPICRFLVDRSLRNADHFVQPKFDPGCLGWEPLYRFAY